jgi:hypothetical protein
MEMAKQWQGTGWRLCAGLRLAAAGAALCAVPAAPAQNSMVSAPQPTGAIRARALSGRLPEKPSQPPAFSISVEPLGFSAPGALSLGERKNVASLDFLDENRLLFTFRVPGLIRREAGESDASDERQIRAVVLALPGGTVAAEALWTVHDRWRYLWMLSDGRFLLRDRKNLELGDATLELKPFLHFPGPLIWLEMDPAQQFMVTESREPALDDSREAASSPAAETGMEAEGQAPAGDSDVMVRILRRDSGQVMLVSRSRSIVHLPINSEGYLESLRGVGGNWRLNLSYFSGGSRIMGQVNSTCSPFFNFLSEREVLVTACNASGRDNLIAMTNDGRRLWEVRAAEATLWPLVVRAPDGLRLAREVLAVSHPVSPYAQIDQGDVQGQLVQVLDAADGEVRLQTTASPVLDAGGNVAISPSGQRVAVLDRGAIQVFELPSPAPLPAPAAHRTGR